MADKKAVASGNWSSTSTWDGGTLPASGDDVYANNFVITVDQSISVKSLRNTTGTGITQGGYFLVSTASGQTITVADGIRASTHAYAVSSSQILRIEATSGSLGITAVIQGGNSNLRIPVRFKEGANCTVTFTGDILGGSVAGGYGVVGQGTIGTRCSPTIIVNGEVDGSNGSAMWLYNTNSSVTLNGIVWGGDTSAHGLEIAEGSLGSNPSIVVNAEVIGGNGSGGCGIYAGLNNGTADITVNGFITGGTSNQAYGVNTTGPVRCSLGYRWSYLGVPPVASTAQYPMLMRSAEGVVEFSLPSDDMWPLSWGDPIVLTAGGGGGEPPTVGVGWPPRYWG